jgi:membrane protease YdiL (CAAX protease family)
LKKILKGYILWTYGVFYCFLLLIGITMLVLKFHTLAEILKVISAWTATFVFVVMFHKIYPKDSLIHFIKRQVSGRIKISTVACIILLQFFICLGSILFKSIIGNMPIKAQLITSWTTLLAVFANNLIQGPLGEELGWRGFVLNELQKKFSSLKSAIIVGAVWGFWHAPLWFIASGYEGIQLVQYIIFFMVSIISLSIIMTVFYNLTHNLVITMIIHQFFNYFTAIQLGDRLHTFMVTALLYFIAALVLVNYKGVLFKQQNSSLNNNV